MSETLEVLKFGKDIISGLIRAPIAISETRRHFARENASRFLREVYFTPYGVIGLIDAIGNDKPIDENEFSRVMKEFRDGDAHMQAAAQRYLRQDFFKDIHIDMSAASTLQAIAYGKIQIRKAIWSEFGTFKKQYSAEDRAAARALSDELEALNRAVQDLEKSLNPNSAKANT